MSGFQSQALDLMSAISSLPSTARADRKTRSHPAAVRGSRSGRAGHVAPGGRRDGGRRAISDAGLSAKVLEAAVLGQGARGKQLPVALGDVHVVLLARALAGSKVLGLVASKRRERLLTRASLRPPSLIAADSGDIGDRRQAERITSSGVGSSRAVRRSRTAATNSSHCWRPARAECHSPCTSARTRPDTGAAQCR